MDFYEVVEKRRTVRKFKGPATEAQLMRILVAGTKAPSGTNQQRWEFIVVDDPALIDSRISNATLRAKKRGGRIARCTRGGATARRPGNRLPPRGRP